MRYLKLMLALLLFVPTLATADAPDGAEWYLHIDFEKMRSEEAGKTVYSWLDDEVFSEVSEESGLDLDKELDSLTAFSVAGQGPIIVFEGNISQTSKDRLMTFIAAEGDLQPLSSSGKDYYRLGDPDSGEVNYSGGDIEVSIESLEEGAWLSFDIKNKVLITASEGQMQDLLNRNGKVAGNRGNGKTLLVLTAEKTLLQASMDSGLVGDDGDSDWDSNILRNTEQVAFLLAAARDKLALEARLITTEPKMAESLASVARGLISLVSFDDSMDPEARAMLQGTRIEAEGNTLTLSLAVAPGLVTQVLSD